MFNKWREKKKIEGMGDLFYFSRCLGNNDFMGRSCGSF
jgi:hypothetical protein